MYQQRKITVAVTSADPSGKVFKGIYHDSKYASLASASKSYNFTINAGATKALYIRYAQKPITVTFKHNSITGYTVTGSFGTVTVGSTDVVKTIEFPDDTTPSLSVGFTSVAATNSDWKISQVKINGTASSLPSTTNDVTPGSNITVEVTTASATTTTTSTVPPAILKLQSNVSGTEVRVSPEGLATGAYTLSDTTQTNISIDMINAPIDPNSTSTKYI